MDINHPQPKHEVVTITYTSVFTQEKRWMSSSFKGYKKINAKSLQSCLTLCDPIDGSLPGSPVPGSLQARTLEWVAISFSHAWNWKVKAKSLCCVRLLATPWTAAYQAPLSMGFSRQEYWSGVPLPSLTRRYMPPKFLCFLRHCLAPAVTITTENSTKDSWTMPRPQ